MIYAILEWTCTIAALIAFVYRWITLSGANRDPAQVALTIYFLGSFLSFFVGLDLITPHIEALFHLRNITIIMSHAAIVVLTAAQQAVLIYWTYPPEAARRKAIRRVGAYGLVLVLLVTMFFLILPPNRNGTSETSSLLNMTNKSYAAYLILFTVTAAVGQVITLRMSWTFSKISNRAWLRRSMYTVAAGAVLILVYCVLRIAEVVGTNMGVDMTPWNPTQWLAGDVGSLLQLLGWTAPGWGPLLSVAGLWIVNYVRYQRLRALWLAMHTATPEIALNAPRSRLADMILVRDLNYRLYRRVIEILDGRRSLRPYLAPAIAESINSYSDRAGVTDDQTREAVKLHAALHTKAYGGLLPLTDSASAPPRSPDEGLDDEIKRMVALAKAFRHSEGLAAAAISDAQQGASTRR